MKKIISILFLLFLCAGAYAQEITYTELQDKDPENGYGDYPDLDIDLSTVKGIWVSPESDGTTRSVYYMPKDESYIAMAFYDWWHWNKEEIIPMDDNDNHFMDVKGLNQTSSDPKNVFGEAFWILPDGKLKVFMSRGSFMVLDPVSF